MAIDITKDILEAKRALLNSENGIQLKLEMAQNDYGEETPVNTELIKKNNEKAIILSDDVQFMLDEINKLTLEQGKEIPFFLTGERLEDETIKYDGIIVGKAQSERAADFSNITNQLNKYVNENKDNDTRIVCHGHTHPTIGDFHNNFSITDLGAYVNFKNNEGFGKIDTMGLVLVNGNYNFIEYDGKEFQTLPNVLREIEENEKYQKLSSYSHEKNRNVIQNEIKDNVQNEENEYVKKFTKGWDNTFNDIAENSGLNKNIIKERMLEQADALNNTVYQLKMEGKINSDQEEAIYNSFNNSFNQTFEDFQLQPLTNEDIEKTVISRNYVKEQFESGKSIEEINNNLNEGTIKYKNNQNEMQEVSNDNKLVEYKKPNVWEKIKNKIINLYKKVSNKNVKQDEIPNKESIAINEYGEIIRGKEANQFRESLQVKVNDVPIFTAPTNEEEKDISLEDFNER